MPAPRGTRMNAQEMVELMKLNGWTQKELSAAVGVHESTVSLWLDGKRNPIGPARILMRQLLDAARKRPKREPVPA